VHFLCIWVAMYVGKGKGLRTSRSQLHFACAYGFLFKEHRTSLQRVHCWRFALRGL
jgi:hypothetical protein